jgi:5-methylcytosine-specific restriction endonuclease McrA
VCLVCGVAKPATTEFFYFRNDTGTFRRSCKACISLAGKLERLALRPLGPPDGFKECTQCRQQYPATGEYFNSASHHKDGLSSHCKECLAQYHAHRWRSDPDGTRRRAAADAHVRWAESHPGKVAEWRRVNADKWCEFARQWRAANPGKVAAMNHNRRARVLAVGGTFGAQDVRNLLDQQEGRCLYCGCDLSDGFHVDHMIPIARGGSNGAENLALACPPCNLHKSAKTAEEFLQLIRR